MYPELVDAIVRPLPRPDPREMIMAGNSMADISETHARLADIGIPSKIGVKPPCLYLEAADAEVLAELAGYAHRRGYKRRQALQEIASRHPHPYEKFPDSVATCKHCGRSEIFSIHRNQDGDQK
jgi:hypothetical protein